MRCGLKERAESNKNWEFVGNLCVRPLYAVNFFVRTREIYLLKLKKSYQFLCKFVRIEW